MVVHRSSIRILILCIRCRTTKSSWKRYNYIVRQVGIDMNDEELPPRMRTERLMDKAHGFVGHHMRTSGNNPKPVILHCFRIGEHLLELGYPDRVILGGILHDIIEDSDVTETMVEAEFGPKVSDLVAANTFDSTIRDKEKQFKEAFDRCLSTGKDALLVRSADIYQNFEFYNWGQKNGIIGNADYLIRKNTYFIKLAAKDISEEPIFIKMKHQVERFGSKYTE